MPKYKFAKTDETPTAPELLEAFYPDSDGLPMYRLYDEDTGWSVIVPAPVYDQLMELPEQARDKIIADLLSHAESVKKKDAK